NLEKYGVEHHMQNQKIQDKKKQTCLKKYGQYHYTQTTEYKDYMINNNIFHSIDGQTLQEYYDNSELQDKVSYSTVQQNYNKYGENALSKKHYEGICKTSKIANLWLKQIEKEL